MKLGDIVPARLTAPDYSPSAPLFLSTLEFLSGGNSYYNPAQAAQNTPLVTQPLSLSGVPMTGPSSPAPASSPVPMPSATTAQMPSITATANQYVAPMPVVTQVGTVNRMPSIVNPAPAVIEQNCADGFSSWVSQNTVLAAVALGLMALMVLRKR